jgi:hypothetical protein
MKCQLKTCFAEATVTITVPTDNGERDLSLCAHHAQPYITLFLPAL